MLIPISGRINRHNYDGNTHTNLTKAAFYFYLIYAFVQLPRSLDTCWRVRGGVGVETPEDRVHVDYKHAMKCRCDNIARRRLQTPLEFPGGLCINEEGGIGTEDVTTTWNTKPQFRERPQWEATVTVMPALNRRQRSVEIATVVAAIPASGESRVNVSDAEIMAVGSQPTDAKGIRGAGSQKTCHWSILRSSGQGFERRITDFPEFDGLLCRCRFAVSTRNALPLRGQCAGRLGDGSGAVFRSAATVGPMSSEDALLSPGADTIRKLGNADTESGVIAGSTQLAYRAILCAFWKDFGEQMLGSLEPPEVDSWLHRYHQATSAQLPFARLRHFGKWLRRALQQTSQNTDQYLHGRELLTL